MTDWGPSPYRSAHHLLVRGPDYAVFAGWGAEYDLVTLLRVGRDGVHRVGGQCRVVLPDGIEAHGLRYTCRGADLHAFSKSGVWYRTALDALSVDS